MLSLARQLAVTVTAQSLHFAAAGTGVAVRVAEDSASRAGDAVACALELQRRLAGVTWPEGADIRIRIALNTGAAELRGGHYYGQAVYRCARILATAHGGQVLVSQATSELVGDTLPQGAGLADLGFHHLKDLDRPERIFQLEHPELESKTIYYLGNRLVVAIGNFGHAWLQENLPISGK